MVDYDKGLIWIPRTLEDLQTFFLLNGFFQSAASSKCLISTFQAEVLLKLNEHGKPKIATKSELDFARLHEIEDSYEDSHSFPNVYKFKPKSRSNP